MNQLSLLILITILLIVKNIFFSKTVIEKAWKIYNKFLKTPTIIYL